jgi:hypothetical protein
MFKTYGFLSLCLFSFTLLGCASAPKIEYVEIPDFKSVAVVQAEDLPSIEKLRGSNERFEDAADTGVVAGGSAGLASGVLLCGVTGPFAGLCISSLWMAGGGAIPGAAGKSAGDSQF